MGTPTVAEVDQIAVHADPVVRNLRITHCYYELSQALALVLGRGANWCTFATWASKQAGQTIRGDDLRRVVEDRVGHGPEVEVLFIGVQEGLERLGQRRELRTLREAVLDAIDLRAALRRAGEAVARGNLKVFEEIGAEFARFLAALEEGADPERVRRFCDALRPGDPPDGQGLLRDAFTAYAAASEEADPKARAEQLLFANLLVGLHEQTRLQPEISASLNLSLGDVEALRLRVLRALLPGPWLRLRLQVARVVGGRLPLDIALDRLIDHLRGQARRAVTEALLTLHLPRGHTLRLGRDLGRAFPEALARLTRPELTALLARIDPTLDSAADSGAVDWADLPDRMHFIADLFRTYHAWDPLFDAPFTPAQVAELQAGRRPSGPL